MKISDCYFNTIRFFAQRSYPNKRTKISAADEAFAHSRGTELAR
jgi:hypothetical protein